MLTVRFTDPDGRPLSGVTVGITRAPGEFHDIAALTDTDGRVAFAGSGPGTYEFFVLRGGDLVVTRAHVAPGTTTAAAVVE